MTAGSSQTTKSQSRETTGDLRARIGRLRRRIDRRFGTVADRAILAGSWRRYIERHPARALLAAIGTGMALATFIARPRHDDAHGAWPAVLRKLWACCFGGERPEPEEST